MDETTRHADDLAARVKRWRTDHKLSLNDIEALTDIPVRTLNGIEQGRGFRYPKLLDLAMTGYGRRASK